MQPMFDFILDRDETARPLYPVRPADLARLLDQLPAPQVTWLRDLDFAAKPRELEFLPGTGGLAGAVAGLGNDETPFAFGHLARSLPEGTSLAAATRRL